MRLDFYLVFELGSARVLVLLPGQHGHFRFRSLALGMGPVGFILLYSIFTLEFIWVLGLGEWRVGRIGNRLGNIYMMDIGHA